MARKPTGKIHKARLTISICAKNKTKVTIIARKGGTTISALTNDLYAKL